jgi:hypothetical protein
MNTANSHCCKQMDLYLHDPNIPIIYCPAYREYSIPLLYKGRAKGKITVVQNIFYCPWCDTQLPTSVRDEWFNILEKEYGLTDPYDQEQEKLIPQEFHSDEWWKKRGL